MGVGIGGFVLGILVGVMLTLVFCALVYGGDGG
jgi:hypothetical protein